ncbi:uncharacterized protein LOC130949805 [Arachis stenosperma]|uniref:uncharacterized protein LOC130949805 n=1 Tax=Arachis stenosperma TaxID=217475 RepID=UPI0025ACB06D|nr:uncharacterized protein LOC130949805 [Arachis stenosperma]
MSNDCLPKQPTEKEVEQINKQVQEEKGIHKEAGLISKKEGGSLFLFDRMVLRYFRKDGHNWRKKKHGKTVKEAHEKLNIQKILTSITSSSISPSPPFALKIATRFVAVLASLPFLLLFCLSCCSPLSLTVLLAMLLEASNDISLTSSGQCVSHVVSSQDNSSESKLRYLLDSSEYVLTFGCPDGRIFLPEGLLDRSEIPSYLTGEVPRDYLELLTNALDHENWSLVQFLMSSSYSGYGTFSLQQVKKFTNVLEKIMYDLRKGSLRGLEEGGTAKEIEFKLYYFCIFFQYLVLEFELEIYFAFKY